MNTIQPVLQIECPYCGLKQAVKHVQIHSTTTHAILYCDNESGGCERPFVLESAYTISVTTKIRAIDGYQK